jgi:hypothetical protein
LLGLILGNDEQQRPAISTSDKRIEHALQLFGYWVELARTSCESWRIRFLPQPFFSTLFTATSYRRRLGHFKTTVRIFLELTSEMHRSDLSTKSTGTRGRSIGYPNVSIGGLSMTYGLNEAVIDEIVASCNGDLRGAVRALLLVNEQLEAELAELYAAAAGRDPSERRRRLLH